MAIKLITNYSKRLGLPGFSSHQFSVSVESELTAIDDIPAEAARLYQLLQANVDEQMLATGFVPPKEYGLDATDGGTTAQNNNPQSQSNQSQTGNAQDWQRGPAWKCTDKQRDLILKLVEEHNLDKAGIEALAVQRFGKGVRLLYKVEASGLIDELFDTYGGGNRQSGGDNRRNGNAYGNNRGRRAA